MRVIPPGTLAYVEGHGDFGYGIQGRVVSFRKVEMEDFLQVVRRYRLAKERFNKRVRCMNDDTQEKIKKNRDTRLAQMARLEKPSLEKRL